MLDTQKYWNPILETTPPEKIKQLQLSKFKKIFRWAYERSKFHRRIYDNAGIKPEDVQSFEDIKRVPRVEKSMMRDIQRKEPFPYGEALCVPLDEVTIFRQTSGTTGQPVYQPDTWQDWEWWTECWSYILWAQGYRPKDRVFIPFGYNIFVAGDPGTNRSETVRDLLDRVGLGHRRRHYPSELSGGEQQRTAVARALVHRPRVLVADEPTGNLDSRTGAEVVALLDELRRVEHAALLLATHDAMVAAGADRIIALADGHVQR